MRTTILAAAIALIIPATAQAGFKPYVPPGNSAANQYVESVPTATGNRSTHPITSNSSSGAQLSALAPGTQAALVRQGKDGARAAALVQATAPANERRHGNRHTVAGGAGSGGSRGGGSPGSAASAPAGTLLRALTGSGTNNGLGSALPVLLAVAAVALGGIALWRRRVS